MSDADWSVDIDAVTGRPVYPPLPQAGDPGHVPTAEQMRAAFTPISGVIEPAGVGTYIPYRIPRMTRCLSAVSEEDLDLLEMIRDRYRDYSQQAHEARTKGNSMAEEAQEQAERAWNIYRAAEDSLAVCLVRRRR